MLDLCSYYCYDDCTHMRYLLNTKGFTLVEMIIVIAIISLLSTIGTSSYTNVLRNARDTKRKADLNEFVKAIKLYQVHHRNGPAEVGYCQSSIGNDPGPCPPTSPTYQWERNQSWIDLVDGGYLEELPVDPVNNTTYYYYYEPDNPGSNNYAGWPCPSSAAYGNCGGWIRARLEATDAFYYVYWDAP